MNSLMNLASILCFFQNDCAIFCASLLVYSYGFMAFPNALMNEMYLCSGSDASLNPFFDTKVHSSLNSAPQIHAFILATLPKKLSWTFVFFVDDIVSLRQYTLPTAIMKF